MILTKEKELELSKTGIIGHVLIKDINSNEILLDKFNSIHYENMSVAIGKSLASRSDGIIETMWFGSGGSVVSGTGAITYFPTNVSGTSADLYNPTYYKVINDLSSLNTDQSKNYITIQHISNTTYTDVIITCTLDYGEPSSQDAFDNSNTLEGDYIFDEIGLKSYNTIPADGSLLTHVIFSPITKSLNRLIEIVYTLRISMV